MNIADNHKSKMYGVDFRIEKEQSGRLLATNFEEHILFGSSAQVKLLKVDSP